MLQVVSVSLGSARRDYRVTFSALGQQVVLERRGTGGRVDEAERLLRELDGRVDALGLGGVNFSLRLGRSRYHLPLGRRLQRAVRRTPLVDGEGFKDTLERDLVGFLQARLGVELRGRRALVLSALDRFGLAEALAQAGARLMVGDPLFALGLPLPFGSLQSFALAGRVALPLLRRLPLGWLYPLGRRQEVRRPRFAWAFERAQVVAGDFHLLWRYAPSRLDGKVVITSGLDRAEAEELGRQGAALVVSSSPELGGRASSANAVEAVLVALGARPGGGGAGLREVWSRAGFVPWWLRFGPVCRR
ncbi:MAG: hypothetical protein K6T75_08330 [Acetobacteraceae bacterium]|nr:hypothetical protein [Acetobacteraceae bacterium]